MKNIKRKIKSLLTVVLAFMLYGCSDYVEPKYVPEFPWRTVEQFEMAVIQPYAVGYGGWSYNMACMSWYEMLAMDMCTPIEQAAPNNEWRSIIGRLQRDVPFESLNWIQSCFWNIYRAICASNEALDFLKSDDLQKLFPKNDQATIDANIPRAKAELIFWRAYSYYWGMMFFCPPYDPGGANADQILPLKIDNKNVRNTKIGTTKEIADQIIADLKEAKSLMPQSWYKSGRTNYWAISGLLARMYFMTGDFVNAEKECTEILNHYGPMGLPDNPMAVWTVAAGQQEPKNEAIWMFNTSESGKMNEAWSVVTRADIWKTTGGGRGRDSQGGWNMCKLSNNIIKRIGWMVDPENGNYTETDLARADKRYGNTWLRVEGYKTAAEVQAEIDSTGNNSLWDKYEQRFNTQSMPHIYPDKYGRTPDARRQNQPLMRVPEFYIMRAAIRFKNNDKSGAAADLKVVRDRAGLTGVYELTANTITQEDIDREHVIELGAESLWQLYHVALRKPFMPGDRKGVAPVNPPYAGWYWKISIYEVLRNNGYDGIPDPNSK